MSTTVNYKGNAITTVNNETKTLTTAGKWLEGDIQLVDVSSSPPSLQSKTVSYTPSETAQTATVTADTGYDGLSSVNISVGAISGTYVGSQVPTQAAQTIHPSTTAQTIASGKYLTGDQTVEAVTTNITADKIVSGFTAKIGSATDDDSVLSLTGTAETGGGWTVDDIEGGAPTGDVISTGTSVRTYAYAGSTITGYTNEVITSMTKQFEFYNCKQLTKVHLPNLTTLATQTFNGCSALPVIVLPSLTTMTSYNLISNCSNLTIADFGNLSKIRAYTFNADGKLRTLVLRRTSSITGMDNWNYPCMGGIFSKPAESTIYVPSALIETYKTATNWSTAYDAGLTFTAIEGSQYENYYADGTAIS